MSKEQTCFISHSAEQTMGFGRRFAQKLRPGDVVALEGDLGVGKTTFVKGLAKEWGVDPDSVHSPTFSLINEYNGDLLFYHMDFYRLEHEREAIEIGAEEYFYRDGICVVEWPGKIQSILPDKTIWIILENTGPDMRQINITENDR